MATPPSPHDPDSLLEVELSGSAGFREEQRKQTLPILTSPPSAAFPHSHSSPSPSPSSSHPTFLGASLSSGVFNLSNSIIGAGIMGLPATFRSLGLLLGCLLLLLVAYLNSVSISILIKTSTIHRTWSYTQLVEQQFGSRARLVLVLSVIINNVGICIVYLIIIADVLSGTVAGSGQHHTGLLVAWNGGQEAWWCSRYLVILLIMLLVLTPLVSLKHVDSLRYTSALSILLALIFVLVTVAVAAISLLQRQLAMPRLSPDLSSPPAILAFFNVIPVMATAYVCHFNIHPIYSELKDRSEDKMMKVASISLSLCTVVYVFTSFSGYLLFGDETASDVLVNFDKDLGAVSSTAVNDFVRLAYVFHVMLVFPVIYYALRSISFDLLFPHATVPLLEDNKSFFTITFVQMAIIYLGAVLVPNIWMAFEITGATTTMILAMVFPGLLAMRDYTGVVTPWEKNLGKFMLVFSAFVSITGVVSSIYIIVTSADSST